MMKVCIGCKKALESGEFYSHKGHIGGLSSRCRTCCKIYNDAHYSIIKKRPQYKEQVREYHLKWYKRNYASRRNQLNEKERQLRRDCIDHYGRKCACCGELRYEFLAIDHINGGGHKHRKELKGKVIRWLVKNNFPPGFRVLCHNCNLSLGFYKYCPHEKERISRSKKKAMPLFQMEGLM